MQTDLARRQFTFALLAAGGAVAGCAAVDAASADTHAVLQRRDAGGRWRQTPLAQLIEEARGCQFLLLGERHDNAAHHQARATLIAGLGLSTVVVAEHLPTGRRLAHGGGPLLERLQAAGFDATGWEWPVHEPLFAAIDRAGLPLIGGNADKTLVRDIARQGESVMPLEWRELLARAPLPAAAEQRLDYDLIEGHCGQLPPERLPRMRAAQRARDAAMALALVRAGGQPGVLIAGNGHVRHDYGVPLLLQALAPRARVIAIGLLESDETLDDQPYDWVWIHPPAMREDPCAGMR